MAMVIHTYAQLVESFRDENAKPGQRTVAIIGRVDEADGGVDSLPKGLLRARGKPADLAATPTLINNHSTDDTDEGRVD